MKDRCYNANHASYKNYGGRGITVCKRWKNSFVTFSLDMGEKPSPAHSLDRYPNNDGNYKPSNCRWATRIEQMNNRRGAKITRIIAEQIRTRFANGERNKDLANEFGLHKTMIRFILSKRYWK